MLRRFSLAILLALAHVCAGQVAPSIQWEKSFGGSGDDEANCIQQTADSGYIIAGSTTSSDGDVTEHIGNKDFWIVKIDAAGKLIWQKCFGGSGDEEANSVQQTNDGGYVVAGYSNSTDGDVVCNHGGEDYWILKLDRAGIVQWKKCYGGSANDRALSVQQTFDNGFIVAGFSASKDKDVSGHHGNSGNSNIAFEDYWIVKIDSAGQLQWQCSAGGTDQDNATSIQQTSDHGFIVAGFSTSQDDDISGHHASVGAPLADAWIVKFDSAGTLQWQQSLGGSRLDQGCCIRSTRDGGYILAGLTFSTDGDVTGYHGDGDFWIAKLDDSGKIKWENSLGGIDNDQAYSVQQTIDGGYLITGFSSSSDGDVTGNHGKADYWIVQLDSTGMLSWENTFGGTEYEYATGMQATLDSGVIVAGYSNSTNGDVTNNHGKYDFWIVKLAYPPPEISSSQSEFISNVICSDVGSDTLWVHNIGGKTVLITASTFGSAPADFTLLAPTLFPDSIAPGDSLKYIIAFTPQITGTQTATLSLFSNDIAHNPWPITLTGRKDSVGAVFSRRSNDTLDFGYLPCGTAKDTSIVLTNVSTIPATFTFQTTASSLFAVPVSSAIFLNTGEKQSVVVHFAGTTNPGAYTSELISTDTCGHQSSVYLVAHVDSVSLALSSLSDVTLCPMDTNVQSVTIQNRSHVSQVIQITGGSPLFSISSTAVQINAGDSATMQIIFHGAPVNGIYPVQFDFFDACGGEHVVAMNVTVAHLAPLSIVLQADPAATLVGAERKVFVIANPIASITGGIEINISNEPTALQFDSLTSNCNASVIRGMNTNTISFNTCAAPTSDTIATLYYNTLVGSTLTPTVTLQNVQTANTCNTVSGAGFATINLLPPGCELGTVIVHSFTTSINSVFPNPATGVTTITYFSVEAANVSLTLYDILGRTLNTFVNAYESPGSYTASFDSQLFTNGLYYLTLKAGSTIDNREIFIMR